MEAKNESEGRKEHEVVIEPARKIGVASVIFKSSMTLIVCFIGVGLGVLLTFWITQQTASKTWMCYERGGVIRIPVSTVRDNYNTKAKPIWALYTTFQEKQYYLWEIGIEKDGPRLYRRYDKPVYILDERMMDKLSRQMIEVRVEAAVHDAVQKKSKVVATTKTITKPKPKK